MATATSTTTSQLDPQVSAILDQVLKQHQQRTPLQTNMILGAMRRLGVDVAGGRFYDPVTGQSPPGFNENYVYDYLKQLKEGRPPFADFFSTGLQPDEEDILARNAQRGVSDVLENTPSRGGALESNLRNTLINAAMSRSAAASHAKQLGLERAGAVAGVNTPIPGLPRGVTSSTTRTRQPTPFGLSGIGGLLGLGASSGLFGSIARGLGGLFSSGSSSDLGPALDLFNPSAGTLLGDTGVGGIDWSAFDPSAGNWGF